MGADLSYRAVGERLEKHDLVEKGKGGVKPWEGKVLASWGLGKANSTGSPLHLPGSDRGGGKEDSQEGKKSDGGSIVKREDRKTGCRSLKKKGLSASKNSTERRKGDMDRNEEGSRSRDFFPRERTYGDRCLQLVRISSTSSEILKLEKLQTLRGRGQAYPGRV